MSFDLRNDAQRIIQYAIQAVQPDEAVRRALAGKKFGGRVRLVSVGKAAWQMANVACKCLEGKIEKGIVITKYNHVRGDIPNCICYEAGHPVPDDNTYKGTRAALDMIHGMTESDTVLFLLSGGGSALFEQPLISENELQDITVQLLASGADIVEMNIIRKRLSSVKGGRFALQCAPARVFSVVLSDILGDPLDMIASGPACEDQSTCAQAIDVVEKYQLHMSESAMDLLNQETPKKLYNVESHITGSVRELCNATATICRQLGYEPMILADRLCCQAKEAGMFLSAIAQRYAGRGESRAFIVGGETVVQLTGSGKGGRNQELALSAAEGIDGLENVVIFSVGSDGTDGPTDAAGGIVDGESRKKLLQNSVSIHQVLTENNAYYALKEIDGLIVTGPTGTNVNDVSVVLIR